MGGAERVGRRITSEVRWDQSHLIQLSSHQAPKSYFAGGPSNADITDKNALKLAKLEVFIKLILTY